MKKLKNSKYKNTGFIFDVLIRNVTTEILDNKPQSTINLIKKFFHGNSELAKEIQIYKMLSETNKSSRVATDLLTEAKNMHSKIDVQKLNSEKYKLIGELNKSADLKTFFETRVPKYTEYASIYKFLNYSVNDNPVEYLTNKDQILEQITNTPQDATVKNASEIILENTTSPEERKLVFKTIINLFNEKYSKLNIPQKKLLTKFINENTTDKSFLKYCQLEACKIKNILRAIVEKTSDPVLKIKLNEITNLTSKIETSTRVNDEHISSLLKYYELLYLIGGK